jgi:tRNA(Ile2) C34 agmatinyltransferase TiaS
LKESKDTETVDGNCIVCNKRTRHAVRAGSKGNEYFECMKCGNEVDLKAFVYDNLDALSEDG